MTLLTTFPMASPTLPIMDVMPEISPAMMFRPASSSQSFAPAKNPTIRSLIDVTVVTIPVTNATVRVRTQSQPEAITLLMRSQFATMIATRPTTAAMTSAIGPIAISHARATFAAWKSDCAPMNAQRATNTAPCATITAVFATAAAAVATHDATTRAADATAWAARVA